MKPLFLVFTVIASICLPAASRADDPLEFSFYLVDHEGERWQLMRFEEKLVFLSMKPRFKPNNNNAQIKGTGTGTIFIEPAEGGPPVLLPRIHLLDKLCPGGPYALSIEGLGDYVKAYLTADYSTAPPIVRLQKTPAKEGLWKFVDSGKLLQAFVRHDGDGDSPKWLSLAESGAVVPAVGSEGMVIEVRDAILTAEKKHSIRLKRHTESR